jgi:hypothetical protein
MPERFQLYDLDAHVDFFRRAYPRNKNISVKIRQTLQLLRNAGDIKFLGKGTYRRVVPRPASTIDIDFTKASHFKSAPQRARVALEAWARLNLWCHNCGNPNLMTLPPNTPVADLVCLNCKLEYQVKSQSRPFYGKIKGAAFEPLRKRVVERNVPDHILIEYDRGRAQVVRVNLIRGIDLTGDRLRKRNPLSSSARRRGWVGCDINITGLTLIEIVRPTFLPRL